MDGPPALGHGRLTQHIDPRTIIFQQTMCQIEMDPAHMKA